MPATIVLFSVFSVTVGNATVFATLGLFGRGAGLGELEVGAIFASSGLLFFLTSSLWGRLSDRIGRGPVMAMGLVATAVSLFLYAGLYAAGGSFLLLLLARSIYGSMAGSVQPAAVAWMADRTAVEQRAGGVAGIGAAVGLAGIVGPVLSATVVGFGLSAPVIAGGVLAAIAAATSLVGLRDEPPGRDPDSGPARIDGVGPYLLVGCAMVLGFGALPPTTAFYVQDRFGLATAEAIRQASLASAGFAAGSFVAQAMVVRRLSRPPRQLLMVGLALCLGGAGGSMAAPTTEILMMGFLVLGIGYGLALSGLTAAVSVLGGRHRQGQAAGRLQAAMSGAWIVGALAGGALYSLAIASPLLVAAAGSALALVATAQIRR